MRMKNIHENTFRLIQIHCYDFTQWDFQQWWLILFCNLHHLSASKSFARSTNYLIEVFLRKISQVKQIKNIDKQKCIIRGV